MSDKSTINTSITLPVDLWNEMQELRLLDDVGVSRYIQSAIRFHNKRVKTRQVREFLDVLDEKQMILLQKELKKRS